MKMITVGSVAMSALFSLSLSDSIYAAGRDLGRTAAHTITERAFIPQPERIVVAARAPSKDLSTLAHWVETQGRVSRVEAPVANALGVGLASGNDLVTKTKSYKTASTGIIYIFSIATVNGRRELLLARMVGETSCAWRANAAGEIVTTVFIDNSGELKIETVPNELYESLFRETVEYFLTKLPQ